MKIFVIFILAAVLNSCASYRGAQSFSLISDVTYATKSDLDLNADIYSPEGNQKYPGVILVHGGGWRSRSKDDMDLIAKSLSEHGFVVMNINYRLAPDFKHPAPAEDLKAAHRFLLENAGQYKLQKNAPIGLWGYSSGGHTISYYLTAMKDELQGDVGAVVSGGAPYFLTWYPKSPYLKDYLGGFRTEKLKEHFEASIDQHLHPQLPPYFLYHAHEDELVEPVQSTAFQALLEKEGIESELYLINFWGHTMAFVFSSESVKKGVYFLKTKLKEKSEPDPIK